MLHRLARQDLFVNNVYPSDVRPQLLSGGTARTSRADCIERAQLSANRLVKLLAAYTALGFVVMEILYLGVWCRPFHNYWALPTPNIQCSAATNHLIVNAVFNISSDVVMLSIALTLFIRIKLPLDRKLILCGIFGLGVFVILSAVLNKYYSFTHLFSYEWTYWYVRESSTAILVANLPFTWTLLRRIFNLKAFSESPNKHAVPWHSSRSAAGRHPKFAHAEAGTHSHDSASLRVDAHGSPQSSVEVSSQTSPSIKVPDAAAKPGCGQHWKDQGVYGRCDLIGLALDRWDTVDDLNEKLPEAAATERVKDFGNGGGGWSRRMRDEEAQNAMQDDLLVTYFDADDINGFGSALRKDTPQ